MCDQPVLDLGCYWSRHKYFEYFECLVPTNALLGYTRGWGEGVKQAILGSYFESWAKRIKVDAEKCDLIGCWDDLRTCRANINLASDLDNDIIKLYHIEGMPPIIYSIFISRDMTVNAYKGDSSINLRDVIPSFDWKICLFSELENIVNKKISHELNNQGDEAIVCSFVSNQL